MNHLAKGCGASPGKTDPTVAIPSRIAELRLSFFNDSRSRVRGSVLSGYKAARDRAARTARTFLCHLDHLTSVASRSRTPYRDLTTSTVSDTPEPLDLVVTAEYGAVAA